MNYTANMLVLKRVERTLVPPFCAQDLPSLGVRHVGSRSPGSVVVSPMEWEWGVLGQCVYIYIHICAIILHKYLCIDIFLYNIAS